MTAPKGRGAVIAGVALADPGKVATNPYGLIAQASLRALADAGISPGEVDGLGSTGLGTLPPIDVGEFLGLRPRWIDSTSVGGASWEVMVAHAADAIAAGSADVVLLTYGSTAKSDLRRGLRTANLNWGSRGPLQWEAPYGHTLIAKYAMAARRHMHEYGTTIEQLAEVAVSARFNAADNPEAAYRDPITVEEVLAGRMIADPFTKLQCCIRSDGGAAAVIVSEERGEVSVAHRGVVQAVDLPRGDPGVGEGTHRRLGDEPVGVGRDRARVGQGDTGDDGTATPGGGHCAGSCSSSVARWSAVRPKSRSSTWARFR